MTSTRCFIAFLAALLVGAGSSGQPSARPGRLDGKGDPLPDGATLRIGSTRLRHLGEVRQLRFTPDGKHLASIGDDQAYCAWDLKTGAEVQRLQVGDGSLRNYGNNDLERLFELQLLMRRGLISSALANLSSGILADDGKSVLLSGAGKVRFLDTVTGKEFARMTFKDEKPSLAVPSRDGKLLARFNTNENRDSELIICDIPGGKLVHKLRLTMREQITMLCFSSDNKYLAGAGNDSQISLWDLTTGKRIRRYDIQDALTSMTFAPKSHKLVTGTNQGVSFWDLTSDEEVAKYTIDEIYGCAIAFSPDGATLATSGKDHAVLLWDVGTGEKKSQLTGGVGHVTTLAFSADGKQLAAGTIEGSLHLWDVAQLREITPVEHRLKIQPIAFVNAKTLLVRAGHDHALQHLDIETGKVVRNLFLPPNENAITTTIASNGKIAAHPDFENGGIQLWDTEKNRDLVKIEGPINRFGSAIFSADCSMLASLGNDKMLRVWSTRTAKEIHTLEMPFSMEDAQMFQVKGRIIALDGRGQGPATTPQLAFSQDNRFLVSLGIAQSASIWDLNTGKERGRFTLGNAPITQLILSPDGRMMATVSHGEVIRIWDTLRGKMLHGFFVSEGEVRSLVFAPSSKLLAAGTGNGSVVLFDLAQGKEKRRYAGHRGPVTRVLFAPDGGAIVSAGEEGAVLFWDVHAPAPTVETAAVPSARQLTELWERLGSADPMEGFRAVADLAAHPAVAVKLLESRMTPAKAVDAARLQQLIADLRHPQFTVRERANQALIQLDTQIIPSLQKALGEQPPAEVAGRIKTILEKLDDLRTAPQHLQEARCVELLERIGNTEAFTLLETLSTGAPHARLTMAAGEALERRRKLQR
jgi:WD40 repeat protein